MSRRLSADHPEALTEALRVLEAGGVVALPTETFYGLAVDPFRKEAVERLYRLKERQRNKPLLLLIGSREDLKELVAEIPEIAERLMEVFWPGPLTLVFRASGRVPSWITAGTGTVALRLSSHPLARELPRLFGKPVTGTSANLSGAPPAETPEEIERYFPEIDFILDGGRTPGGLPSTLVSVVGGELRVLRPGAVPEEALRPFQRP